MTADTFRGTDKTTREDAVSDEAPTDRARELIEAILAGDDDANLGPEWAWAAAKDPEWVERYARFAGALRDDATQRTIPRRYHELFVIVVLAARGFHWTLPDHMRRALEQGATHQEILEALELAVLPGGAPAMHLGLRVLLDLDEEDPVLPSFRPSS